MITKTIKRIYIAKFISSLLFLIFIGIVIAKYPFREILFPKQVTDLSQLFEKYKNKEEFLELNIPSLSYTGYDEMRNSKKIGSYYYCFINDTCVFFLIGNDTSNQSAPSLQNITIQTKPIYNSDKIDNLTSQLAADLLWSTEDLSAMTSNFIVSESDALIPLTYLLLAILGISGIYSLCIAMTSLFYLILPSLSPFCDYLGKEVQRKKSLSLADLEYKTKKEFHCDSTVITANYLMEYGQQSLKLVPIAAITLAYKYSKLRPLFGLSYHVVIHTLHGTIRLKRKDKAAADSFIDYLCQKNPNIIKGYSKENIRLAKLLS